MEPFCPVLCFSWCLWLYLTLRTAAVWWVSWPGHCWKWNSLPNWLTCLNKGLISSNPWKRNSFFCVWWDIAIGAILVQKQFQIDNWRILWTVTWHPTWIRQWSRNCFFKLWGHFLRICLYLGLNFLFHFIIVATMCLYLTYMYMLKRRTSSQFNAVG